MTKSRMTLVALLLLASPGAAPGAEPVSAEHALRVYRQTFLPVRSLDCPPVVGDEIVVCGRPKDAPDPNRLPLPVERELPPTPCASETAINRDCPRGSLLGGLGLLAKIAKQLIDPDE